MKQMPVHDETAILDRARRGDRDAQRVLFERHRDAAFHVVFRIVRNEADALDVVQDAFIRAFEQLAEFQQDASFRTWLLRIASNRSLDLLRSRKVRLAVSIDGDDERGAAEPAGSVVEADPGRGLEQADLAARLATAIDSLSPEHRAVFSLFATGEMSYQQIAAALGIPIGTVMSRLFHARRRLAEKLEDLAPHQPDAAGGESRSRRESGAGAGRQEM